MTESLGPDLFVGVRALGFTFAFLSFLFHLKKKVPWEILLFCGYTGLNGILMGQILPVFTEMLFLSYFAFSNLKLNKILFGVITGILFCDLLWFILGHQYGVMNAITFDVAIMAIAFPLIGYFYGDGWMLITAIFFPAFTVFFHARTAQAGFVILFANAFAAARRVWLIQTLSFLLIVAVVLSSSYWMDGNATIRLEMWATYLKYWNEHKLWFLGAGFGNFDILTFTLPVQGLYFKFMHNDFIEILFETGLLGWVFTWLIVGKVLINARRNSYLFSSSLCFIFTMLTYFPSHYFLSQLLGVILLKEIYRGPK